MLPVMIRYDEIAAGEINHAIRVTVPHTQNTYIWPARAQAGVVNTGYPPMGQRFRLKASYDISGFSPTNQIILKAMKKYGMILADNGWDQDSRKWWIYGVSDSRWDSADLWELTSVKGTDFEAVDVSSMMIDPNSRKGPGILTPMLPSVKVGIYKDGFWYLDKNGNGRWDAGTDTSHNFGVPGWTSVPGDWDGDGKTTLGIAKDGSWYLDYDGNGQWNSGTDKSYHFGSPGWTPVAGDWDGDQKSEIGVFQNGIWYLDTDGSGLWNSGDKAFQFGSRGWTPVAGDWDGEENSRSGSPMDRYCTWIRMVPVHGIVGTKPSSSDHPGGHRLWVTGMETKNPKLGFIRTVSGTWMWMVPVDGIAGTKPSSSDHKGGHRLLGHGVEHQFKSIFLNSVFKFCWQLIPDFFIRFHHPAYQ